MLYYLIKLVSSLLFFLSILIKNWRQKKKKKELKAEDFPGGPVVKTSPSSARGVGSIHGWGVKIPHASQPKNQNLKTEATL